VVVAQAPSQLPLEPSKSMGRAQARNFKSEQVNAKNQNWRGWDQFCMLFTILGAAGTNFACYLQYLARLWPILHAIYYIWRG